MSALRATLLGTFRLQQDGEPLVLNSTRLELLLAYLLLHTPAPTSRQSLAFQFWPDSTDSQARTNLRKVLYRLRRRWPDAEHFLHITAQDLRWRDDAKLTIDMAAFNDLIATAENTSDASERETLLQTAVATGRGELLPGHYEEWIITARERHRRRYLDALETLVTLQEQRRGYDKAIDNARRLLELDPLHEEGYRRLMRLHALAGDRASALRVYHTCATQLRAELDVAPSPDTQRAYEQLLQREVQPPVPTHQPTPLVARQDEWQRLQRVWRQAARGAARVVLIRGEAGIGKTRLAAEMRHWAMRQGITTLQTTCYAAERELPYAPLMAWLRSDPVRTALATLDDIWLVELSRLLPKIKVRHPHLPAPQPLTTPWQRHHLFEALVQAVQAAGEPLLLIIDDLHWCDPESIAWLTFLLRTARTRPLLLLGTVRSEDLASDHPLHLWRQALQRQDVLHEITLDRLDLDDTLKLAGHTGSQPVDRNTAVQLHAETEGNPLFIVEWLRAARTAGGSPLLPAGAALPDKVYTVLEARLNRLSAAARSLAGGAAFIGRSFSGRLLAAASDLPEDQLLDSLDELWHRQIIREQGTDAYDFSHNKLRQVARASLPPGQKRRWRRRIIAALHAQHQDDLRPVHDQLAAHYHAIGEVKAAINHYHLAAQAATAVFAHQEAVAQLRRALTLADPDAKTGSQPVPPAAIAALYEALGDALTLLGQRPSARTALKAALAHHDGSLPRAQIWLKIAQTWLRSVDYQEAAAALDRASTTLGDPATVPAPGRWRTWLDIQMARIDWLYFQARLDELDALCAQIHDPVLAHGDAAQKASYFVSLVMVAHRRQRFVSTTKDIDHQREALKWARAAGQTLLVTRMTFSLGFTLLCGGLLPEAAATLAEAVARSRREGNRPVYNQSLAYLTVAHRQQGQAEQVRARLDEAMSLATAEGNPFYLGVAWANQAWLAYRDGDVHTAVAHAQQALDQWHDLAYPFRWLALWPRLAAALGDGEWDTAVSFAHPLLDPEQQKLPDDLTALLKQLTETPTDAGLHAKLLTQAQTEGYL